MIKIWLTRQQSAFALYHAAEAQARNPVFYQDGYAVPDTPYGRFDMIALHCYIIMRRLQQTGQGRLAQGVFDVMFKTLDMAMREMGIGDLSVPKKIKKFMQDFNGRVHEYDKHIENKDGAALKEALRRNLYATAEQVTDAQLNRMLEYVQRNLEHNGKIEEFTGVAQ